MQRIFLIAFVIGATYLLLACKKQNIVTPPPQVITGSYKTYLALGDSYTIGQSVTEAERFPSQTVSLLKIDSINFNAPEYIATTGWTTGNLINAINATPPARASYDFVTLLIGVNNQYQGRSQVEYATEFTSLLNTAIQFAGNRPYRVAVLSIPDWSVTPFANGQNKALIAKQIDSFNIINKQIALAKSANYIDITASTRMAATDPSLVATDGLHPSGKEYNKWAVLLAAVIKSKL
ncbi:GDSL-type esterase/lipase family protein [Ferruginibacter sp. SUN106]|uniref:GDSL-type esterase/lipase family protein n=1 Tax=Ferruginibacter sp. SUN106 TaxID=2978348 RepID=UPI003D367FF0